MPRFAVLRHDSPQGLHWDFLLEVDQELRTWALPQPPEPGIELTAEELPRHRLAYLDYEGPVSDGRGCVTRWDGGSYEIQRESGAELVIDLSGEKLTGRATLERLPDDPARWRFTWVARSAGD